MSHAVLTNAQTVILEALYVRHCGGSASGKLSYPHGDSRMNATPSYAQLVMMGFCRTVTSESGVARCHLTDAGLSLCKQTFPEPCKGC